MNTTRSSIRLVQVSLTLCLVSMLVMPMLATDDTVEMRRYRCGYNAVYLLLRLSGLNFDYNALEINRNSGKDGLSVKELVEELSRCGLPSHAIQCDHPEDVRKLEPPFIIYTNPDRSGKTIGHFLVVTSVDAETIDLIDGTTSQSKQYAIAKLGNLWDGFAIVPEKSQSGSWRWVLAGTLAIGGLILVARPIKHAFHGGHKNA
jgi:ABC-type bacteriocin/lantibiotic exporter with double-glycine peptidase domain